MSDPTSCRSCGSGRLSAVLSLGSQHLSDFRTDDSLPPKYPLDLMRCSDCELVQLERTVPRDLLYHERYGFKSGVSDSIRDDLADVVNTALRYCPHPRKWLDIGCNDGTLLSFVPKNCYRIGVDPVALLLEEGARAGWVDRAVHDYFPSLKLYGEKVDVITAVSMFYDVPALNAFAAALKQALAPGGVLVIQQNYLGSMIEQGAVDNVCHEHVTYFSLRPQEMLLARHGLAVVAAEVVPTNGGSIRTIVQHARTTYPPMEEPLPCDSAALADFAERSLLKLGDLGEFVRGLPGRTYVLGASTRGATLWQGAGLDFRHLLKAVERNPAKVGRYFSAIGCPIISEEQARAERPDYMLVGPWFFRDEIVQREHDYLTAGGHLIFPLPSLEVVGASGVRADIRAA